MNINNFLENWTHTFCGKRRKVEVLICKILYKFSIIFLVLTISVSNLLHILHYVSYFIKIYVWNMLCKLINYLNWKELNPVILGKSLLTYLKGYFCLPKGHLDNLEEQGEVKYSTPPPTPPLIGSCFLHFQFKLRKKIFSKKAPFKKAYDPQTLHHSEIGPSNNEVNNIFSTKVMKNLREC